MRALPPLSSHQTALFLDFDGTLAELAPQPEAVQVPADLVSLLHDLSLSLNGALAIVSGRRMHDLDQFLAPLLLPTAAEHGGSRRLAGGEMVQVRPPDLTAVTHTAQSLVDRDSRLRLEVKSAAVALHYRHAPELETLCLQRMTDAARDTPGVELLHGKFVLEIKPAGVSKGHAIAAFMQEAPFAGRVPLFAGDDTTDEAGFAWVQTAGGYGLKIGAGASLAQHRCDTPADLRAWLATGRAEMQAGQPTRRQA